MSTHTNSGLQDALKEYLYTPRYLDVIDSLTPTSIFRFNASETGIVDLFNNNSEIFAQELKLRLSSPNLPWNLR